MIDFSSIGTSSSQLDTMISQLMALERQPVHALQAQRSAIDVTTAIFTDLRAKLNALKSAASDLASIGSLSVFSSKTASSSKPEIVSATASGSATAGTYSFEITRLAQPHRVQSDKQPSSTTSTGFTGVIRVQDALITIDSSNNSLQDIRDAINAAQSDNAEGVEATIIDNRLVLQSKIGGSSTTMTLADVSGNVLSSLGILTDSTSAKLSAAAVTASSSAVGYDAAKAADGLYGDGNAWQSGTAGSGWVQIDLGSEQSINRVVWGRGEASDPNDNVPKDYTIQVSNDGVTWTTVKTVTGHSFAAAGDNKTDSFNQVTARYVRMDITATNGDPAGAPMIDEFEVYSDTGTINVNNQLQAGSNAEFTVNGVAVQRTKNVGLTDVVSGLTIDLKDETTSPVTLTVATNTDEITTKIKSFLTALNDVTSYLKAKSAVTKIDENTYTRGGLAGYYIYTGLRSDLYSIVGSAVSGVSDDLSALSQIGITLGEDLSFTVSDSTALSEALANNLSAVTGLFNHAENGIANRINSILERYVDTGGYLDNDVEGLTNETNSINDQIKRMNELLALREQQLRQQYSDLFNVMAQVSSEQSYLYGLLGFSTS